MPELRIDDTSVGPEPFRLVSEATGEVIATFKTRELAEKDNRYRMSTQINPISEWEDAANALIAKLRVVARDMPEINDIFAANGVEKAIADSFAADLTGNGIVAGTGITANHAVMWRALMSDSEAFLSGRLSPIEGIPVPEITRRIAIQRRPAVVQPSTNA